MVKVPRDLTQLYQTLINIHSRGWVMVKVPRDLTQLYQTLINISFQGMGNGERS